MGDALVLNGQSDPQRSQPWSKRPAERCEERREGFGAAFSLAGKFEVSNSARCDETIAALTPRCSSSRPRCSQSASEYICKYTHGDQRPPPETPVNGRRPSRACDGNSRNRLIVRALERELREDPGWSAGFFEEMAAADPTRCKRLMRCSMQSCEPPLESAATPVNYVLDANAVSAVMKGDARMLERLRGAAKRTVRVPQTVLAEIAYGIARLPKSKRRDVCDTALNWYGVSSRARNGRTP